MSKNSVRAEHDFINGINITTTKQAWDTLKGWHEVQGLIQQVLLIQEVLKIQYTCSGEDFSVTSSRFANLNEHIWNMGNPSPDLFLCILMINGLSGEFTDIQSSLARELAKATTNQPYKPINIHRPLDVEQQLISGNKKGRDVVLSTQSNQAHLTRSALSCSNCKRTSHLSEYCISEGGEMAGKLIKESRAARKQDREAKWNKDTKIVNLDTNTIINENPQH